MNQSGTTRIKTSLSLRHDAMTIKAQKQAKPIPRIFCVVATSPDQTFVICTSSVDRVWFIRRREEGASDRVYPGPFHFLAI